MFEPRYSVIFLSLLLTIVPISGEIRNQGWWRNTVFYQVYPRSFMDSDNDGVGDLKGIINKLDHFIESGVGAIWLSPINRSPMVDSGYDISDFKDIDKIFGTLTDFENLLKRAKKIGLKVVLDLVPNHTSDEHYWFQMSLNRIGKYEDYYIWADGKNDSPPNNWISVFGGPAWTFNKTRNQWYFHQFHSRQPDLNYSNPHVQEEMREIILYWLRKGVDGFRINAVPHLFETNYTQDEPRSNLEGVTKNDYDYLIHTLTKDQPETYDLVQSWRNIVDEYASIYNLDEKVIMTEAYTSLENTIKYYNYGSHVPFNFNFIMNATADSNATVFKEIIDTWMNATPAGSAANWVMGNHDRNRTASRFPKRADQMTMLAMILPGIAVTYYGEEIGMVNNMEISWSETKDPQACNAGIEKYKSRSRDPARTPYQWNCLPNSGFSNATKTWLPVYKNYFILNLLLQKDLEESHYLVYRALTDLRNKSLALQLGSLTTEVLNNTVLCVIRKIHISPIREAVILLINFSKWKQEINLIKQIEALKDIAVLQKSGNVITASVGSRIRIPSVVRLDKIIIPPRASIVFTSKASNYVVSFLSFLSLLFSLIVALCK